MPAKSAARSTSAKKSPTSRKTATGKRTKTTSPAVETVAAAEPAKNATHVNAKLSTARAPARAASRNGGVVATGVVTRPASAAALHNLAVQNQELDDDDSGSLLSGPRNVQPYIAQRGEQYMSDEQLDHFRAILSTWKQDLMREVDRTVSHMKDEAANFPDPNDRATQEEEFSLELRTRDRERKLIRKIDEALKRIDDGSYGYCLETGEEIGVKRLEARPVATLSIEAQERRERRERQYGDRDDRYR